MPVSGTVGFGGIFETVLILNEPAERLAVIDFVGRALSASNTSVQHIGRFAFTVDDVAGQQEVVKRLSLARPLEVLSRPAPLTPIALPPEASPSNQQPLIG